jgi:predicted RNA-binding Zn ribbon-like protein
MVNTQEPPGALETIRALLNTWSIPNDTRVPTDLYTGTDEMRALRDDLRHAVEHGTPDVLNRWISRLQMRPLLTDGTIAWHGRGDGAPLLAAVLTAVADGTWPRLKACPDCRWVFYDTSRNASKRWCLMTAGGPTGRSCGSIAKVQAYRKRAAAARSSG